MPFVLDNSVVAGWFLEDQATPYTDAIATRLEEDRAVVPALWQLEFANVPRTACKRNRIAAAQAQQVIEQICMTRSRKLSYRTGFRRHLSRFFALLKFLEHSANDRDAIYHAKRRHLSRRAALRKSEL